MNKRIEMLEKLTKSGQADAFAFYALGMEYRKEGRVDDAVRIFAELRAIDGSYLPVYLMAGQMLAEAGRTDDAREWLGAGVAVARTKGDGKTLGELESELAGL